MIGCGSDAGDRRDGCKQEVAGAAGQDQVSAVDRKQCFSGDRSPARRAPSADLKDQTGVSVYSGSILTPE